MSRKYSLYIFIGALFILGLSIGFFAGKYQQNNQVSEAPQNQSDTQYRNVLALYDSQNASLRAEITAVEGDNLRVKNLNNNLTGIIRASANLMIIKGTSRQVASSAASLSTLELNKEVLISLRMQNGLYEAYNVTYPLPAPSLRPIPAQSTQPQPSPQPSI